MSRKNDNRPCEDLIKVSVDLKPYGLNTGYECVQLTDFMKDMGEAHFQKIIDKSDGNIKMFGTAEEFCAAVKDYQWFTGNHLWFDYTLMEPYDSSAVYTTSSGASIFRKIDIYALLQESLFRHLATNWTDRIFRAIITLLLKTHETEYKHGHEFVFCADIAEKIEADVKDFAAKVKDDIKYQRIPGLQNGYIQNDIRKLMPTVNWNEFENERMEMLEERFINEIQRYHSDGITFSEHFYIINYKIKLTETFLKDWLRKVTKLAGPEHVIQVIRDGENSYVLEEEVVGAIPVHPARFLRTLPLEKVMIMKGRVELIETTIQRTKHCVKPILTSTGRLGKPAFDVLLQVLRGCFFGYRLFQKIKKNEWKDVEIFFKELKAYFDPEQKSVYYLDKSDIKRVREGMEKSFKHLESRPAKDVRIPNRLTVESLKKELVYLGITGVFPDSVSYVEESLKKAQGADIFTAIEHCLTECLFKKIPYLAVFAHNQNVNAPAQSEPSAATGIKKRFSTSCWKEVDLPVEFLECRDDDLLPTQSCELFNNNYAFELVLSEHLTRMDYRSERHEELLRECLAVQKDWDIEIFLVDGEEIRRMQEKCRRLKDPEDLQKVVETFQEFQSLKAYTKFNLKRVYLRTFNYSVFNQNEDRKVFTVEVLKAIPVLLEQQGDRVDQEKLEKFRVTDENATMTLVQLKEILEEFDVNKELLALAPDITHCKLSVVLRKAASGVPVVRFPNPSWVSVMEVAMAKFHIFQSVVCDVDWTMEVLQEPENSKEHFKAIVIEEMKKLGDEGVVTVEAVEGVIEKLKEHPNYKERMERKILTPLIKLFDAKFNDTVSLAFFLSECQASGIECRLPARTTRKNLEEKQLAAWKARLLFLNAWIEKFFSGTMEDDLKRCIRTGLLLKVPIFNWKLDTDFTDLIFMQNKNGRRSDLREDLSDYELVGWDRNQDNYNHSWLQNTSYKDRDYITRCTSWIKQEFLHAALRMAKIDQINTDDGKRDEETNILLRGMISMQNGIKSWVKEILRTENEKFYGGNGWTPQEIVKIKELKNALRYVMDEVKEKRPTNSGDEENEYLEDILGSEESEEEEAQTVEIRVEVSTALEQRYSDIQEGPFDKLDPQSGSRASENRHKRQKKKKKEKKKDQDSETSELPSTSSDLPKTQENEDKENSNVTSVAPKDQKKQKNTLDSKKSILVSLEQKENVKQTSETQKLNPQHPDKPAKCVKCPRISERCDNVTKERDAAIKREEKLKRKLEACQKANEKLREQLQGMVPKKELEAKIEELDEVVKSSLGKEQEHQAQMKEWEERLQEANSTIDQLTKEKSKVEAYNTDTHRIFKELRNQLPQETLASLDIRMSLEVRDVFYQFYGKQDNIISTNPIEQARKKVVRLKHLTEDPDIRGKADYDLVEFKTQFHAYEKSIKETIAFIRNTPLLTKPEIPCVPKEPDLHPRFYTFLRAAQEAKNEELENECMICKNVDNEWISCPGCKKRFGFWCLHGWFEAINRRTCPHCHATIPE